MERYWFKAKRYGYGWTPSTWQAWVVLAIWFATFLRLTIYFSSQMQISGPDNFYWYLPLVLVITGALLLVCWLKGEPARWRWGDDK